jgi:FtsP/CotA-like multicopper oxidase with cupredoxin domain
MPVPQTVTSLLFGMGERYEVVIDFSVHPKGARVVLQNLGPKNNIDYDTTRNVMAFDVVSDHTDTRNNTVPDELNPHSEVMRLTAKGARRNRRFNFGREGGEWTINSKTWQDVEDSNFTLVAADPTVGDVEVWELRNASGGWFHPVHIHLVDFRILDRNKKPPLPQERGPKDTVYVAENETVRVVMRFGPHTGRYMMHCHNLVHEDHDMMTQFVVRSPTGGTGDDPIRTDPCKNLPEEEP